MISLEINPPHGGSIRPIIEKLKQADIAADKYVITDNPLSRLRMDSVLAAIRIQEEFGKPAIATMSMRDKNKLGLQSTILGANEFGITNFLALTGDKAKKDEKGVNEGNSLLLLDIIEHINRGENYCGRKLDPKPDNITPYAVIPSVYSKSVKKRMEKKISHGACGLFTQPFFDLTNLEKFIEDFKSVGKGKDLFIGFFPFVSAKTVVYINDNIPGIDVPKEIIDEMQLAKENGNEYEIGLKLSREIYAKIREKHPHVHIMSNNNFELIKKVMK